MLLPGFEHLYDCKAIRTSNKVGHHQSVCHITRWSELTTRFDTMKIMSHYHHNHYYYHQYCLHYIMFIIISSSSSSNSSGSFIIFMISVSSSSSSKTITDAWCNGLQACFPSLPPMLECRFKSWLGLGLEFLGFSMWHFLELVVSWFFFRISSFLPSFIG